MTVTDMKRFWSKIDRRGPEECWPWTAGKDRNGYGKARGCTMPGCCNPDHLEPVTHAENVQRGKGGANWAAKTHCPAGHPYSGENLYIQPDGRRSCRTCKREAKRRSRFEGARGGDPMSAMREGVRRNGKPPEIPGVVFEQVPELAVRA